MLPGLLRPVQGTKPHHPTHGRHVGIFRSVRSGSKKGNIRGQTEKQLYSLFLTADIPWAAAQWPTRPAP